MHGGLKMNINKIDFTTPLVFFGKLLVPWPSKHKVCTKVGIHYVIKPNYEHILEHIEGQMTQLPPSWASYRAAPLKVTISLIDICSSFLILADKDEFRIRASDRLPRSPPGRPRSG